MKADPTRDTKHTEVDRTCIACEKTIHTTAEGLKAHFNACKLTRAILPNKEREKNGQDSASVHP